MFSSLRCAGLTLLFAVLRLPLVEFCEHSAEVKCVALPSSDADDFSASGSDGIGSGMVSPWGVMATLLLSGAADGTQDVFVFPSNPDMVCLVF